MGREKNEIKNIEGEKCEGIVLKDITNLNNLKCYAEKSHNYLKKNSDEFSDSKELIQELFNKKDYKLKDIKLQLLVIDTLYSTNASKNNGAIDEIAKKISELTKEINRNTLSKLFEGYLNFCINQNIEPNDDDSTSSIDEIFKCKYGYSKTGINDSGKECEKGAKKAMSLISKYAYFITWYKFPIYDSFVKEALNKIKSEVIYDNLKVELKDESIKKSSSVFTILDNHHMMAFIKIVSKLNEASGIKDYEKLDNLIWVIGKIRKGGFPLLLGKEKYLMLIQLFDDEQIKSKQTKHQKNNTHNEENEIKESKFFSVNGYKKTQFTTEIIKKLKSLEINETIISRDLKQLILFSDFD